MSTAVTIFLMFIALEASIIVAVLVLANEINLLERQLDAARKLYSDSFEKLVDAYDGLRQIDADRQEVYRKIIECDASLQKMFEQGHEIDKKILETWKGVQETYSFAYEEYRQCIEKLESLDKANADIYAKLLTIEENTKPEDTEWDPFDDDDFWEVEDEQESDETRSYSEFGS